MKAVLLVSCCLVAASALSQDSLRTLDLKEVVVTGQFEPQSLRKSVYQVRVIDREAIRMRSASSVQNILNTELGVRFSNDLTLGTSDISVMGMSGQNVKILLDGVPLLDRGATKESLNQIDVNAIERIEIVEGPMAVVYGADALAGVVNIITKRETGERRSLSAEARVLEETAGREYDAFSGKGLHMESVHADWRGTRWNASAGLTRNAFGGWKETRATDSSYREWHPKDQWLAAAGVGYDKDSFNVWYRLNYLNENILSEERSFTDPFTNARMAIDKEYITNRYTHQLQATWQLHARLNLNLAASHQDYTRKTQTTTIDLNTGDRRLYLTEAGAQDASVFRSDVLRTIAVYKPSDVVSLQAGFDINLNTGSGDRIDGSRSVNDFAAFVSSEINVAKQVSIRPAFRVTYNSVYDAPPVIPSLNAKATLSDAVDLRFSYAYGFRAPALRELYFTFHDASHDIDGNPDLKAEHSNSFNGSLVWRVYKTSLVSATSTLGGFYNRFENMIMLGNIRSENPNHFTYINIQRNKTTGFTWSNAFHIHVFQLTAGFSYIGVSNQPAEEDHSLPSLLWTPEVNATATVHLEKIGASVSAFYKFTGSRTNYITQAVNGETTIAQGKAQAYHWADFTITKALFRKLELAAGVRNLFDITNVNSTLGSGGAHSTSGALPVGYGRSWFTSLTYRFTK